MTGLMPEEMASRILRRSVGRGLRRSLDSISVAGELPRGGVVLAANHASWWDGYLLGALSGSVGLTSSIMMTSRQLRRFPFLRLIGAVDTSAARTLATRARGGQWVVVFPEGRMRSGPGLGPIHPGARWIARAARVPLVPVAVRVAVRGAPQPEALLRVGAPLESLLAQHDDFGPPAGTRTAADRRGTTSDTQLAEALAALVHRLDADIAAADPERPVPGYRRVLTGSSARRDELGLSVRALAWLTGQAAAEDSAEGSTARLDGEV